MKIGVNLGPGDDWPAMLEATKRAESLGFDAVGFLDHYHSEKLEWPYICGWSAYGALAMATTHIHLVPLVIDRLNYLPGVLAKETATLALLSGGRFELGIGAGDFFEEARAWGTPIPDAPARISGLKETVLALRQVWQGDFVTFEGEQLHLKQASSLPAPPVPPRVMVGAGSSRRLISSAVDYADEINVYADDELIRFARQQIHAAQRPIALSVFVWDWPEQLEERLAAWEQLGVERAFLTFWHPFDQLERASRWISS
jgi:alkanesulfonate monooxygenase SsuD/methylene tetrahydromethanopterin reductase-like flavin-dependent oxidoreductase (luciferase family)